MAMALRPDEQARFTVTPDVVTGRPASRAAARATLPDAATQPETTSSTSSGSTFERFTACSMAAPKMVMFEVLLKPPRPAFAKPVRAYETTTASRIVFSVFVFRSIGALPGRCCSLQRYATDASAKAFPFQLRTPGDTFRTKIAMSPDGLLAANQFPLYHPK